MTFDIGDPEQHRKVRDLADELLEGDESPARLDAPLEARVAEKLARSRRIACDVTWEGRLAIVFAMWGEHRRLRPRSPSNPTGEDSLHVKLDQLDWLFDGTPTEWFVYAVDDGDPEDSASVAEERAAAHHLGDSVRVLRLADAIPAETGPLASLAGVDESRKGGAIVHGAGVARADGCDAVVMTDADSSVNLGQVGLLLGPHARGEAEVVVGDRKHPDSVLEKAEARWGPGIVVLRHMQRMVGRALFETGLRDTQAAFKLYGDRALADILAAPSTYGFAFDSDWLYGAIGAGHPIARVPLAFVDSFAESASITQGPMTTWESLLTGLVAAARARGVDHDEEMAAVVDAHATASKLEQVVRVVPPELEGVPDSALGDRSVMTPTALRNWLESLD